MLSQKGKKKKALSFLPGTEPCENRGQIPTYEPEGNYVSRKYGPGEGKTTQKPVMEMRPESEQGKERQGWRQSRLEGWGDGKHHGNEARVAQFCV